MAKRSAPTAPQLDLFAEPAPVQQAPADPLADLLHRLIHTLWMHAAEAPYHLYTPAGLPDSPRCARLVNLIVRGVASDRPALSPQRIELAIALLPGWWQDVRRDAGADRRVWALVRGETP